MQEKENVKVVILENILLLEQVLYQHRKNIHKDIIREIPNAILFGSMQKSHLNLRCYSDSNASTGNIAGVQIKVSQNGKPYLYPDLRNSRYEVPIVYFDIGRKNDFDEIADSIQMVNHAIEIGTNFVDGQELDEESNTFPWNGGLYLARLSRRIY